MKMDSWTIMITVAAGALAVFVLYPLLTSSSSSEDDEDPPRRFPKPYPIGRLTVDELAKYRGTPESDGRLLISICGRIFDMSTGGNFYGPTGPYHVFTGADASYMLAKMVLEDTARNVTDFTLDEDEKSTLQDWYDKYVQKYPVVGRVEGLENLVPDLRLYEQESQDPANLPKMTLEELREHDGQKKFEAFICVMGFIYDVSIARSAYYWGEFYASAGHDITVALATDTWTEAIYDQGVGELSPEQIRTVRKWAKKYRETYPLVAQLTEGASADCAEWDLIDAHEENGAPPDTAETAVDADASKM